MTLKEKISALEKELEELKVQVEKEEDKIKIGDIFCYLLPDGQIKNFNFGNTFYHNELIKACNIFKKDDLTKNHLEWYSSNVIKVSNRLMQLHEKLCPNYFPDKYWINSRAPRYFVCFDYYSKKWEADFSFGIDTCRIYFSSKETAQEACDILNNEEFMFKEDFYKEDFVCL
jgi:hypothetical protein